MIALKPDLNVYSVDDYPEDRIHDENVSLTNWNIPEDGIELDEVIKSIIVSTLKKTKGNQTQAAKLLGLNRTSLIYRIQKYKISL